MIVALLMYGIAVSFFLTLAGLIVEQLAGRSNLSRRGVWAVTLLLSITVPIAMVVKPHPPAEQVQSLAIDESSPATHTQPQTELHSAGLPIKTQTQDFKPYTVHTSPSIDKAAAIVWFGMSAAVALALALSGIRLRLLRKEWRPARIDGQQVMVTLRLGPAVSGTIRPQILLPQWLMRAPLAMLRVVVAHEREHLEARDPLLLLGGYLAVFLVPWNPIAWWQLRRLRFAIETDCDARVLSNGIPLRTYGEVLLNVAKHSVRAPWVAMAIAKPVSQLERRIRLMARQQSRPTAWLIGLATAISVACVVCALDLQAPILDDSELRKPPLHDWSPFLHTAEAAAQAAYPDLFAGRFQGTVVLSVDLNREGRGLGIHKQVYPAGFLPDQASPEYGHLEFVASMDHGGFGAGGRKFIGWFGPQKADGLYLFYEVLNWSFDPERSAARVRAAVARQYPELFRDHPAPTESQNSKLLKLVTVFMNDDGTINLARMSDVGSEDLNERSFYDRFLALGLSPEQFGHRGRTFNSPDPLRVSHYLNTPNLEILYAWPRRADDPPDVALQSNAVFKEVHKKWSAETESQAPDDVFLKRYFRDIWYNVSEAQSAKLLVLLDRAGQVCDTGRLPMEVTEMEQQKLFEDRYPSARIRFDYSSGAQTANGTAADLNYFWLDDDSRVKECAQLNQRQD